MDDVIAGWESSILLHRCLINMCLCCKTYRLDHYILDFQILYIIKSSEFRVLSSLNWTLCCPFIWNFSIVSRNGWAQNDVKTLLWWQKSFIRDYYCRLVPIVNIVKSRYKECPNWFRDISYHFEGCWVHFLTVPSWNISLNTLKRIYKWL